ncbi:MAG TPA: UDP-glucose/GDP-mannose dehydrogenase family protein [Anaeromyxobacteraceae bacterium]|nr:UDP-glucose/GDP-mannose dehydrogenase family protein [Anaeromyxobacteraceae bacterium]
MRIAIVGAGYVGLVTGTCLAESGNQVTCVDADHAKIATLGSGGIPIYEPGLEELVKRNAREGRLAFTVSMAEALADAKVVFIAVGTPPGETGEADLTHVLAAAEEIGKNLRRYTVIVNKSTVPVGSADRVEAIVAELAKVPFDVVSNPEFLKEGAAIDDFMRPDRIVVGVASDRARAMMAELYEPFTRTERPILFMDRRSAELTKYAANAMLATRISFMNDVAALCDKLGCDVDQVRRGMGADKRIGYPFLFPGCGFGGSCFPKDVRAVMTLARQEGLDFDLLRAVERVNERQKRLLFEKAKKQFGSLAGKRFGVWGLAFKPKTDDMREAPSLTLIQLLTGAGAEVTAHDPVSADLARRLVGPHVKLAAKPLEAAEGADALFLVTEWNEFRSPDFAHLKRIMRGSVLFDGRNSWDAAKARAAGFTYHGVGRAFQPLPATRQTDGGSPRRDARGARATSPAALGGEG